jgi:uncharacterized cupredoxin-like copper-binding protein
MSIRSRPPALAAVTATALCVAALGLAACGGDDESSSSTTAADTSSTSSTEDSAATTGGGGGGETVKVSETEYKIDPSDVTVKPGEVTFDVSNDGQTTHNLEVEGPDGDAEIEGDLAPGDSGQLTVDLSEPGTYEMYCPVDGHKDLGMTGEITVEG